MVVLLLEYTLVRMPYSLDFSVAVRDGIDAHFKFS